MPKGVPVLPSVNSAISLEFVPVSSCSLCPLLWARRRAEFKRIQLTLTTRPALRLALCCLFPIFFGPLAFNLEYFIQFCALGHPKHSRQRSQAALRSRFPSSRAETLGEAPGISAWADMQGLGNAFLVIIWKARDCEARLQLCYICLLPGKCWQWDPSVVCSSRGVGSNASKVQGT